MGVSSALNGRELQPRIGRLALRGTISATGLPDLLNSLESGARSVEVRLITELGDGRLWFRHGQPWDAVLGGLVGEEAFARLLASQDGRFEVYDWAGERARTLSSSVQQAQQAVLSRHGRWRELLERTPVLNLVMRPVAATSASAQEVARRHGRLCTLFDGRRSVLDIIEMTGQDALGVAEAIVELWDARLLEKVGSLSEAPPPIADITSIPRAPRVPQFGARQPEGPLRHSPPDRGPKYPNGRYSSRPDDVEVIFRSAVPSTPPAAEPAPTDAELLAALDGDWADSTDVDPGTVRGGTPNVFLHEIRRAEVAAAEAGSVEPSRQEAPSPERPKAGRFVGGYEVLCRIARGGMGTVYLCRVTREAGLRRLFALKVLRQRLHSDEDRTGLFLQEAYIASRLHHPNVVAVVDAAVHQGQPYLVMDYVDGCSLRVLLARTPEPRPVALILTILMDALAGLQAAHDLTNDDGSPAGVVHADVSPDNLLVGVDGTCRISDFGVAQMRKPSEARFSDSANRGKAAYVSPEQALGAKLDARADVFAIGAILFTALTGRTPFEGASVEETLRSVVRQPVPPPSTVALCAPACLDAICLRALQKDPAQRFPSAAEMRSELLRVAARENLLAAPGDVGRWVRQVFGNELQERRLAILDAARASTKTGATGNAALMPEGNPDERPPAGGTDARGELPPDSSAPPSAPGTVLLPRFSRSKNAVLIVSAALAIAVILGSLMFPGVVGRWFSLDLGTLPLPPPDSVAPEQSGDDMVPHSPGAGRTDDLALPPSKAQPSGRAPTGAPPQVRSGNHSPERVP